MMSCEHEAGCITCGDEATEMEVLEIDAARGLALCASADGRRESVETALVEPLASGETVLVHAGTAIGKLEIAAAGPGPDGGAGAVTETFT